MRASLGMGAVMACVVGSFCLVGAVEAGDTDLAAFLLQHGELAIKRGDYEDALTKFDKALSEDPTLIEARYWIGVVQERRKEPDEAVKAYRWFRREARARDRDDKLEGTLKKLLKKAEYRLKALDAANLQIDDSQEEFADELSAMARGIVRQDANLATRILKVALHASPDHSDAMNLLHTIAKGFTPLPGEFDCVYDWLDVITSSLFGGNPGWTYSEKGDILTIKSAGGTLARPPTPHETGPDYAYTADCVLQGVPDTGRVMSLGLIFGLADGEGFAVTCYKNPGRPDRIGLMALTMDGGVPKDRYIKYLEVPEWKIGDGRRVTVLVKGRVIRLYLNNELAYEHKVSGRKSLAGNVGLSCQNIHVRIDQWRIGAIAKGK